MLKLSMLAAAVALVGCGDKAAPAKPAPTPSGGSAVVAPPVVKPATATRVLPKLPALAPSTSPTDAAQVALGRALFFDPALSIDGSRSCYSCHQNEQGNGGKDPIAIGAGDKRLTRHSPTLWNVAYHQEAFYWDGRAPTLEAQAKGAWGGGNMGVGTEPGKLEAKAQAVLSQPPYDGLLRAAFPGATASVDVVVGALAAYERTMICDDTAYDRAAAGDLSALTETQWQGYDLFMGKGQCVVCHTPPHFSSAMGIAGGVYFNVGIGPADGTGDVGRMAVTKAEADRGAFKPPTLRNISKTAPYFHDGSVPTLEAAVALMAQGGGPGPNKSPLIAPRDLTPEEQRHLVEFLQGLACKGTLTPTDAPAPTAVQPK